MQRRMAFTVPTAWSVCELMLSLQRARPAVMSLSQTPEYRKGVVYDQKVPLVAVPTHVTHMLLDHLQLRRLWSSYLEFQFVLLTVLSWLSAEWAVIPSLALWLGTVLAPCSSFTADVLASVRY